MSSSVPSPRREELLERSYRYVLEHGLGSLSLRPLAAAVGSSPRVLLYLFESKDGLVRALLARAREDELAALALGREPLPGSLPAVAEALWTWLAAPDRRALLTLWTESYARSLVEADGALAGFARATVLDWLALLARADPSSTPEQRTAVLAALRGALLDLLATGDVERTTAGLRRLLASAARGAF